MKERSIKMIVLVAVFVAALFLFSALLNQGSENMTADMDGATLPTISFEVVGKQANMIVGNKREMQVAAVRDQISVVDEGGKLNATIHHISKNIKQLKYEILSIDGKEKHVEKNVESVEDTVVLDIGNALKTGEEALLKITLYQEDMPLYYYSRVVKEKDFHVKECVEYVETLHQDLLHKTNEDAVKKVMEPNSSGNNSTFQHVTIHSDYTHVTWGDLSPVVKGEIKLDIKEAKQAYTSVLLTYQVECKGDNNKKETYNVQEFFKVGYGTERIYLIEYDRTMLEVFDTSRLVLSGKGVILGIADGDMQYKVNEEGTVVAFVHGRELWCYDKTEDAFSMVFSFANSVKDDLRNHTDNHEIKMLSMENDGSMTFSVCGYMNRGDHEGESGLAVYYYNASKNCVKEQVFIPSTESALGIEKNLNELAYYNKTKDILYVMAEGNLLKMDGKKKTTTTLVEGLESGQYVTSDDGHLLAYQTVVEGVLTTKVWDFEDNTQRDIATKAEEIIVPLGFVNDDFVYGLTKQGNPGYDVSGVATKAMHRLEIVNENQEVVKSYETAGLYILRVTIENNMITLKQGVKEGNTYKEVSEDYITNNESSANAFVEWKSYRTELKGTQYRFEFSKGIQDKKAKTRHPKMVLQEVRRELEVNSAKEELEFYAYGHGELLGVYDDAGEAIKEADKASGVVITSNQETVWEDGNKVAWYRNFNVSQFVAKEGESTLAACRAKVAAYEKKQVKEIYLRGCSSKDMCYLLDKGVAIIAMKDANEAVLLVGYDAKTVTYINPTDGGVYTSAFEKVDEMVKGSGSTFIGYVK